MKHLCKALISLVMAVIMTSAVMCVAAAEEVTNEEITTGFTIYIDDDGAKAYELAWKYKYENGHLYKRRWNYTLNCWYDPAWILVN